MILTWSLGLRRPLLDGGIGGGGGALASQKLATGQEDVAAGQLGSPVAADTPGQEAVMSCSWLWSRKRQNSQARGGFLVAFPPHVSKRIKQSRVVDHPSAAAVMGMTCYKRWHRVVEGREGLDVLPRTSNIKIALDSSSTPRRMRESIRMTPSFMNRLMLR